MMSHLIKIYADCEFSYFCLIQLFLSPVVKEIIILQEFSHIKKSNISESDEAVTARSLLIPIPQQYFDTSLKKLFFLARELSLINTCCWRADHEILMQDGAPVVHYYSYLPDNKCVNQQ